MTSYCCLLSQSCPTLCDPTDCSPPGSFLHGILQARHWRVLPSPPPKDLPNPGIESASPALAGTTYYYCFIVSIIHKSTLLTLIMSFIYHQIPPNNKDLLALKTVKEGVAINCKSQKLNNLVVHPVGDLLNKIIYSALIKE